MNQKYEKLKTLLRELLQLDQPNLDFGLYRVMHAKSAEVTQFLDKDLLPQVQVAFGWREGNREVDFVVHADRRLVAIEVKSGRAPLASSVATRP